MTTACASPSNVEAVLRRPWWRLKFPPDLQTVFEAETGPGRCRRLAAFQLLALALYLLLLVADAELLPDVFKTAATIRLGVVTPLALAIILVLLRNPPAFVREGMMAALTVVVAASLMWVMSLSRNPLQAHYHYGVVLVLLYANVALLIRFWYALVASLLCLGIYGMGVATNPQIAAPVARVAILVFASAVVFTLVATHRLERDRRRDFLFGLADRIRHRELEEISRLDPLTGLANRRYLDERLLALWAAPERRDQWMALLLLDIDEFKLFNDTYGHLAGDTCLKRVSSVIAAELRGPDDVAARFGGEELVIIFGDMDLGAGQLAAERIRRAVEAVAIPHLRSTRGVVTVSIGVAAGFRASNLDPKELVAAADIAVYAAKRNGRNQVWPPLMSAAAEVASLIRRREGKDKRLG